MTRRPVDISVIIPVSERHDSAQELFTAYKQALDSTGKSYEVLYVLDGRFPALLAELNQLREAGNEIRIITLAQSFGEAAALSVAFEHSVGATLLTLPAYFQIEPGDIPKLLDGVGENDMVVGRRWPRRDSGFKQMQTRAFHWLLRFVADCSFQDLGCGARAFDRRVIDEIPLYGDQHRFLPLLADKQGFTVREQDVEQSTRDAAPGVYPSGVYLRRVLDILTVFFLVKFTKKPLRFFGLIGSSVFALGGITLLVVVIQRLFFDVALADRPALLLSSLFIVLGIQLFALGLIGELIIFTHAREIKEYTIEQIVE